MPHLRGEMGGGEVGDGEWVMGWVIDGEMGIGVMGDWGG